MGSTKIKNIGIMVSGDVKNPLLKADALLIKDGKIAKWGNNVEIPDSEAEKIIDAGGMALTPGLIDSHCHVVLMDYTPRQNQIGFLASELHGGVTTVISAGEVHLPGRPNDPAGIKALAILAAKSFSKFRPGGMKVIGGGVILEPGLVEKDFEEMAKEGVRVVGEIGLGKIKQPDDAAPMVKWAKKYGMTVMMHTGGTSIPGSSTVTADQVIATDPDIVAHINGGPTAIPLEEAKKLIDKTELTLEFVHCGNPKMAVEVAKIINEKGLYHRVIIGNDAPSGTGVVPLGILRVMNLISSLGDIPPEMAVCMATGNTAKVHKLNRGFIKEGFEADLILMDAPMGSVGDDLLSAIKAGDNPAVAMVLVDGEVVVTKSRNTPPPKRKANIIK
ncbi:MAG: amidohydrolase family protein [Deltaproteobacteria bacterium]|nr:amidohydrolase family protein [Deltaproteobacteria bacterium]